MDPQRFDTLTKLVATRPSRRRLLRALGGGLLGAVLGGAARAAPACRAAGHPCEGNQTCCAGLICAAGGPGAARRCAACPAGTTACGDRCVDLQSDPLNCGACGTHCQLNGVCAQGTCGCVGSCQPLRLGFQCCPAGGTFGCSCGITKFTDPLNCNVDIPEEECPPAQRCIGPNCKACCPPDSTCDPATGTCLQQG